jgi:hypothetical protein
MRHPILLFLFTLLLIRPVAAQVLLEPFGVNTDALGASLGDAQAALPLPGSQWANPATLAGQRGMVIRAPNRRRQQLYDPTMEQMFTGLGRTDGWVRRDVLTALSAQLGGGSIGTFAVDVMTDSRERGDFVVASTLHAARYALSWGMFVSPRMAVGIATGMTHVEENDGVRHVDRSASAPYLSMGILYHESLLRSRVNDEFCFGASISDLGAPLRFANDSVVNLPRTFRAGISWSIAEPDTTAFSSTSIGGRVTGQYANVLNLQNTTAKGFWSLGMELAVYEILYFRYGMLYRPYYGRYSYADNGASTAGAGIHIPLHVITGYHWPVILCVEYAASFLRSSGNDDLFSLSVRWERDLFTTAESLP